MIIRLIIGIYLIGCISVALELAEKYSDITGENFAFSLLYVMSQRDSYKYILLSWYFIYKTDE